MGSKKKKDDKRVKILLKFIQRIYDKKPGMQEVIDASMIEVCTEEGGVSPEKIFLFYFFCCFLFQNKLFKQVD